MERDYFTPLQRFVTLEVDPPIQYVPSKQSQEERERLHTLVRQALAHDRKALALMGDRSMLIALQTVARFGRGFPAQDLDDLIQACNLVFFEKAMLRYNFGTSSSFDGYAMWWMKSAISQQRYAHRVAQRLTSIDSSLEKFLSSQEAQRTMAGVVAALDASVYLAKLQGYKRRLEIIQQHYGLNGNTPRTQKMIATSMGCTEQYVQQEEKRALRHMRLPHVACV